MNKDHTYFYHFHKKAKARCEDINNIKFKDYGARGIKFNLLSLEEFEIFIINNLGERPSLKHSLDRKNNNGNYELDNLRWANPSQQNLNRRLPSYKKNKHRGVIWMKKRKIFWARFGRKYLGAFKSEFEAVEKVIEAYYNHHKKFPPEYAPVKIPKELLCA